MFVSTLELLAGRRRDPLGVSIKLPLTGTYYPLGFRLEIATNSRDVIEAAEESWTGQDREFDAPPLIMRVFVQPDGPLSHAGTHRKQGHLYSIVSDAANFAQI